MCELARGIKTFCYMLPVRRPLAPGTPRTYFVEGNTKKGSDLKLKLKYLPNDDDIKNCVSLFSFSK